MNTTSLAERRLVSDEAIEHTLISGDLSKLTPAQRLSFYNQVCASLDLNPLTKPFAYINLSGKLTLYALKDCTEQLRNKRNISVQIIAREVVEDCYVVTARASMTNGRQDESIGAVPIATLKGEARANAFMKAETKAKRRVTLSICGLGMLDESEIDGIHDSKPLVIEAPASPVGGIPHASAGAGDGRPSAPNGGDSGQHAKPDTMPPIEKDLPSGAVRIMKVESGSGTAKGFIHTHRIGESFAVYKDQLLTLAGEVCQNREPVYLELKKSATSNKEYVIGIRRVPIPESLQPFAKEPEPPKAGECPVCGLPYRECSCDIPF